MSCLCFKRVGFKLRKGIKNRGFVNILRNIKTLLKSLIYISVKAHQSILPTENL